jgi:hypothetical protein
VSAPETVAAPQHLISHLADAKMSSAPSEANASLDDARMAFIRAYLRQVTAKLIPIIFVMAMLARAVLIA